jgi:hypothetical protein
VEIVGCAGPLGAHALLFRLRRDAEHQRANQGSNPVERFISQGRDPTRIRG